MISDRLLDGKANFAENSVHFNKNYISININT